MVRRPFSFFVALMLASPLSAVAEEAADDVAATEAAWSNDDAAKAADCCGGCECEDDCCGRYMYISGMAGLSLMNGHSGGFNVGGGGGGFPNTNSAEDELFIAGGAIGVAIPRDLGLLRLEVEGRAYSDFQGITDSFAPPTPTFFYNVELDNGWSTMVNGWFDVQVRDKVAVYAGGGLGVAGYDLSVDDGVVSGSGSNTEFAWQLGAGLIYQLNDRIELDFGYRYSDLGKGNISLTDGAPAANYTLDVTSHDILLQVRVNEPLSFLRQ